jgi:hypothetical protein
MLTKELSLYRALNHILCLIYIEKFFDEILIRIRVKLGIIQAHYRIKNIDVDRFWVVSDDLYDTIVENMYRNIIPIYNEKLNIISNASLPSQMKDALNTLLNTIHSEEKRIKLFINNFNV